MGSSFARVVWIVLDGVGIGAMPDAAEYGDVGTDTLGNIARRRKLELPNLCRLGLGNIKALPALCRADSPSGAYGRCRLASPGKDSTTGHWEMAGIILERPLPIYPHGFPPDLIQEYESRIGRKVIGNKPASGTEIIEELGPEHVRTGSPIVYTSADSVFQVAAHEQVISLQELYEMCAIARTILTGPHEVGRVIARPFEGEPGSFRRTVNRRDLAIAPRPGMLLDRLQQSGVEVYAIGKISDIFMGRGISRSIKTNNNDDGCCKIHEVMRQQTDGLIFANLIDFDQLYGHRNDVDGFARALEAVDRWLPMLDVQQHDMIIITADHGCDPTTPSTDHSREYTPLLVFGPNVRSGAALGIRSTLADIGQTVADNFGTHIEAGDSFLHFIEKGTY